MSQNWHTPVAMATTTTWSPDRLEFWVEMDLEESWIAAFRICSQAGRPVIGELRVFPKGPRRKVLGAVWEAEWKGALAAVPKGGLGTSILRGLKLSEVTPHFGQALENFRDAGLTPPLHLFGREKDRKKSSAGRPGLPDIDIARAAQAYVDAVGARVPKPVVAVGKKLGLKRSVAKSRIDIARRRGYLVGAGKQGAVGGVMTDRAKKILGLSTSESAAKATKSRGGGRRKKKKFSGYH